MTIQSLYEFDEAVTKMQRHYMDGSDHEYIDTCDLYKYIQRLRKSLSDKD